MRIAMLGTGTMGAPMARNLRAAGHEVCAWNRTPEKAEPLAEDGVEVAPSIAEAVERADVVVTMLADGDAVLEVARDALAAMDGGVLAQMSTIGDVATGKVAAEAEQAGIALVDAPVLGTKQPAEKGELIVLASGPEEQREPLAPLFDAVGAKTVWLGEAGAGTRLKLVVNTWLVSLTEGLAEAIALAEATGVDPRTFLETIDGGPLGVPYAQLKGSAMIEGSFEPAFALALALKDAELALSAAAERGLHLEGLRAVRDQLRRAVELGHGREDMAATIYANRAEGA